MKHRAKQQKLADKIQDFKTDRAIQSAIAKFPGSYRQPGSLKK